MELGPAGATAAMMVIARQIETTTAIQAEILKSMVASQGQIAAMLLEQGLGQSVDIQA